MSSAGGLFRARAGFAAGAGSAALLPFSVAGLRFGAALAGALTGTCAGESDGACKAVAFCALTRGLRAVLGFSEAGAPAFVDDASLADGAFTGAAARSVCAAGVCCVAVTGAVLPDFCSAATGAPPALRCSVPTSSF